MNYEFYNQIENLHISEKMVKLDQTFTVIARYMVIVVKFGNTNPVT